MKGRQAGASLVVLALLLPGLRASAAEADASDAGPKSEGKSEGTTEATTEDTAKPAAKLKAPAEPPAEAAATTEPAASTGPYVPFAPPPPPLRLDNGSSSIQFGLLAQPQFEIAGAPDAQKTTKNLFVRRFRLAIAGTLFTNFEYFFQVDWPNLFKFDPADTMAFDKNAPGLNIQDAFFTFKPFGEVFKFDAGFMLPPLSHNSLESAAKLYGNDYFVNSFRRNVTNNADPFRAFGQSPVGRDAGFQARLLVANGHVEVRGGVFMGRRVGPVPAADPMPAVVGGVNIPRFSARLQINLLDAEPGFFYQGTYHGARKVLSIGGFVDYQNPYKYFGGDLILDLPLGPGILTAQANVVQWEGDFGGGTFIPLPKQRVFMGELGYLIGPIRLSPIAVIERLETKLPMPVAAVPSEDRFGGGVAFWPYGHNSNIKAFFTYVKRDPAPQAFNVISVQWQVAY